MSNLLTQKNSYVYVMLNLLTKNSYVYVMLNLLTQKSSYMLCKTVTKIAACYFKLISGAKISVLFSPIRKGMIFCDDIIIRLPVK